MLLRMHWQAQGRDCTSHCKQNMHKSEWPVKLHCRYICILRTAGDACNVSQQEKEPEKASLCSRLDLIKPHPTPMIGTYWLPLLIKACQDCFSQKGKYKQARVFFSLIMEVRPWKTGCLHSWTVLCVAIPDDKWPFSTQPKEQCPSHSCFLSLTQEQGLLFHLWFTHMWRVKGAEGWGQEPGLWTTEPHGSCFLYLGVQFS